MTGTDQELLQELKDRKPEGFRRLYDVWYPVLCAVAWEYVKDDAVAETLVEDVILGIWAKQEGWEEVVSLRAYLIRCVRNKCIDWLRGQAGRRKNRVSLEEGKEVVSGFMEEEVLFEHILLLELQEQVEQAVAALPEPCRQVFCLSRLEECSYEEIAVRMNISVNTVKYHMKRALSLLRNSLRDYLPLILFVSGINLMK